MVKVEKPGSGDDTDAGAAFLHAANGEDVAAYFPRLQSRQALGCAGLTRAEADLVRALAARADVLVENFRPGTLDR